MTDSTDGNGIELYALPDGSLGTYENYVERVVVPTLVEIRDQVVGVLRGNDSDEVAAEKIMQLFVVADVMEKLPPWRAD